MKRLILIFFIFCFVFITKSEAQKEDINALFENFLKVYGSGDFVGSKNILLSILNSKTPVSDLYKSSIFNDLSVINKIMGRYDEALEDNKKADNLLIGKQRESTELADIYINRAGIYTIQKSYIPSIEYLEKAIRIYNNLADISDKKLLQNLSVAYLNIGIAYYEIKNFKTAADYFNKSAWLKTKHNLTGLALVYLNIAKTYVRTGGTKNAEEFYNKSIKTFIDQYNEDYYRLAEAYIDYGLFLLSEGKTREALSTHKKALSICLKNYGEKHTLVSLSFKQLGNDYIQLNKLDSALYFYQKSLIAVDHTFNNQDIFANPSIDSSLFDMRLLDNLKCKAKALELYSGEQNDQVTKLKVLSVSFETIKLALRLIDKIRNNFMSEESRIYLAENEKETYLFATHIAFSLYFVTHDKSMVYKMYSIVQRAKASILRNEITGNELLYSDAIPDSLRAKQKSFAATISAYNNFILEETRRPKPDNTKISLWKDAIFEMNQEKDKVTRDIESVFPKYHDLIRKTEPDSLNQIQKLLKKDETIVDYLLSNQYEGGKRKLYIFLVSRNDLDFKDLSLDSLFIKNGEIIRKTASTTLTNSSQSVNFTAYTTALNYMYLNLIKPVERFFKGKKLIIIPDEEIGWLSFDAFLKEEPRPDQSDYEGLHYLIRDYTFSYGYSSSLIFSKNMSKARGVKVFAFSPDYLNTIDSGNVLSTLRGARFEIGSVLKWFEGKSFYGENATKSNFISSLHDSAVFHLAMHSSSDSLNSRYSYLIFDIHHLSTENTRLYNYEISLTRIKSPMVVLSACNSGTGTLYHGEGLMSLARSFTLAGASSVIKTAWEINDGTSSEIITRFYYHLSWGKEKNEAMRLAKLEYLKKATPSATNPYFWAAYEVLGDNVSVARNIKRSVLILSLLVIIAAGTTALYFRRRRIFSERSR